jgi:hypothetical protein
MLTKLLENCIYPIPIFFIIFYKIIGNGKPFRIIRKKFRIYFPKKPCLELTVLFYCTVDVRMRIFNN